MLRRHCLEISPPVVESHNSALFSSHNKAPPSPGIKSVVPPERSTRLDSNSYTQGKRSFRAIPLRRTSSCHETCHDSPYSISCRADLLVRLPKMPVPLRSTCKSMAALVLQGN